MTEWIAISQWEECVQMQRAGLVFEIRNSEGLSFFTHCVVPLPPMPPDWKSPPTEFRAVLEVKPKRSTPIPPPQK